MRELTDHIVEGSAVNENICITVTDEMGADGANHLYRMHWDITDELRVISGKPLPVGAAEQEVVIGFHNGPIKENGVNGVTHEAMLAVVIDRLRSFQSGPYSCRENSVALTKCEEALMWLQKRTRKRMARGVEGTHAV